MIIQLRRDFTEIDKLQDQLKQLGVKATEVKTQHGAYLVAPLNREIDLRTVGHFEGVTDVHRVTDAYKLVSRRWKVGRTAIDLNGMKIGGDSELVIGAGPCSIEGEEQIEKVLGHLVSNGITLMRGGIFKPRTSPYSFRGMGLEGLKQWHALAKAKGIRIVSEVLSVEQIAPMYDFVDIYQVGARNSQNFNLLHELGKVDKPVLLKRGLSGTLDELLQSAEYIFSSGNEEIILCERGIRTYEKAYRNTLDLNAVPILQLKSHLPVIVDPSHGVGIRQIVPTMALAAVAAGADGLLLEVHPEPERAASDGDQTLNFEEAAELYNRVRSLEI